MKKLIFLVLFLLLILGCNSTQKSKPSVMNANKISDTVRIANDSIEYEVLIIDGGFSTWLNGQSKPRGFYTESFLENKNQIYVREWNLRASQPQKYDTKLYEMQINYSPTIHYGYEVNYLMYNYFIYFQITNKQQLAGFVSNP